MSTGDKTPAKNPCGSCPYRCNVPSGVWAEEEYEKLPEYDKPTGEQPARLFLCHQQNERICSGWAGTHDMSNNLALRIAAVTGALTPEEVEETLDYTTPVELFESGAEAAEHGMADIDCPGTAAEKTISKIERKRNLQA